MEDLFRSYWWLVFPLSWFVFGAFNNAVNYFRHRNVLKIIKTYADKGEQPPEALLKILEQPVDEEGRYRSPSRMNDGNWFSVVLFGVLACGFGYASWTDMFGAGQAFLIVTFVMGALAAACLVSAVLGNRRSRD